MLSSDALSRRTSYFRKAFGRGLGRHPNALESAAMSRAAKLSAQAELVLDDPTASINDKVRIDGAARRAVADMQAMLHPKRERELAIDTGLEHYLAAKHNEAAV